MTAVIVTGRVAVWIVLYLLLLFRRYTHLLLLLMLFGRKDTLNKVPGQFGKVLPGTTGIVFLIFGHGFRHAPYMLIEVGLTQEFIHGPDHHACTGGLHIFVRQDCTQKGGRKVHQGLKDEAKQGSNHGGGGRVGVICVRLKDGRQQGKLYRVKREEVKKVTLCCVVQRE